MIFSTSRDLGSFLALSAGTLAVGGFTAPSHAQPAAGNLTEVVVTAARMPMPRIEFPGSLTRIEAEVLDLLGATHSAETLNRVAGVYVQRHTGQESLTAIRSPVLSGPGACGAFLMLEDGLPLRPVGFCNVQELFEVNYEQAGALEIVRGPGPAAYGANAVHGIVNVVTPAAAGLPAFASSVEGGSYDFRRLRFAASTATGHTALGLYGVATHDDGFRDDAPVDEAKLNLLLDRPLGAGELRVRASGTTLDQQTAGYVGGFDAYRDKARSRVNENPEAFRKAWSSRLSLGWNRAPCEGCSDDVRVMVRRSHMEFLQHFLLGKPLEQNGQTSLTATASLARRASAALEWRAGVDLEWSDTELEEFQSGPTLEGSPAARAIRPAGWHYDYTTEGRTAGVYAALEWRPVPRWRLGAAARADHTRYGYDNRMIAGNTDQNGVPCAFGGCLYSRPADRSDEFTNFTPKLDASFELSRAQRLYLGWVQGFRPPEMTEMYRLQRQQSVADLDSERLDSLEAGWLLDTATLDAGVSAFALEKRHLILRDSSAFNVNDGRTTHRGLEYEVSWQATPRVRLGASGTVAWHRYDFTRTISGGEAIRAGAEVDTAPRHLHGVRLAFEDPRIAAELEASYVGEYFLDAANTARYPGHTLLNARAAWAFAPQWRAVLRATNLTDRRYADRADFAFGDYRYMPGRGRAAFLEIAWRVE